MTQHSKKAGNRLASLGAVTAGLVVLAATITAGCPASEHLPPGKELSFECGQEALYALTHDQCEPMAAVGEGACRCVLGYIWDGSDCTLLGGCECVGDDCDSLTESYDECIENHDVCSDVIDPPIFECGSETLFALSHERCEPMDAAGEGEGCQCVLGYIWDGEDCSSIGGCECVGADCDSLTESYDECIENHDVCIEEPPIDPCEAMDAEGDGLCRAILGYAFDGRECVMLGGCECLGDDCDEIFETEEGCEEEYDECIETVDPVLTPCGEDLFCDTETEICKESVGGWMTYYDCVPVPEGCEADRSCACASEQVCDSGCDLCIDSRAENVNAITCECLCC